MASQLNEYLEREAKKRNLKNRILNRNIELQESVDLAKNLNLNDSEVDELLEGLSDKLKYAWKRMSSLGKGREATDAARSEYAKAIQDKQASEYGRTGISSVAKAALGTASAKAKAFKLDAEISAKKAALEKAPQGPVQDLLKKQIDTLENKRNALETEFKGQMAIAGAKQAEKAASKQGSIDTKVAKLLARNLVGQTEEAVKNFDKMVSTSSSQKEAETFASEMVNNIAKSLKAFYQDSGIGIDKMPRGVL